MAVKPSTLVAMTRKGEKTLVRKKTGFNWQSLQPTKQILKVLSLMIKVPFNLFLQAVLCTTNAVAITI